MYRGFIGMADLYSDFLGITTGSNGETDNGEKYSKNELIHHCSIRDLILRGQS